MTETAETVEEEAPSRVVEDLSHFKGVRRGFRTDLYVETVIEFTPDDFTWSLTDVYEYGRRASCTLRGEPTPETQRHIDLLAEVEQRYGHRSLLDSGRVRAVFDLKTDWHYKGCRNDKQKQQRKADALAALEDARQLALYSASKAYKVEACAEFNSSIKSVVAQANLQYVETWTEAVTQGNHRDPWVLGERNETRRAEEVAAYRAVVERAEKLKPVVASLRAMLSETLDERHTLYQALVLHRLEDDDWEDNDGKRMPDKLIERIKQTLHDSKRQSRAFPID